MCGFAWRDGVENLAGEVCEGSGGQVFLADEEQVQAVLGECGAAGN